MHRLFSRRRSEYAGSRVRSGLSFSFLTFRVPLFLSLLFYFAFSISTGLCLIGNSLITFEYSRRYKCRRALFPHIGPLYFPAHCELILKEGREGRLHSSFSSDSEGVEWPTNFCLSLGSYSFKEGRAERSSRRVSATYFLNPS